MEDTDHKACTQNQFSSVSQATSDMRDTDSNSLIEIRAERQALVRKELIQQMQEIVRQAIYGAFGISDSEIRRYEITFGYSLADYANIEQSVSVGVMAYMIESCTNCDALVSYGDGQTLGRKYDSLPFSAWSISTPICTKAEFWTLIVDWCIKYPLMRVSIRDTRCGKPLAFCYADVTAYFRRRAQDTHASGYQDQTGENSERFVAIDSAPFKPPRPFPTYLIFLLGIPAAMLTGSAATIIFQRSAISVQAALLLSAATGIILFIRQAYLIGRRSTPGIFDLGEIQ